MSLNVLSAADAIGFYTYNQINLKKDLIFKKIDGAFSKELAHVMKSEANKEWSKPTTKGTIDLVIKSYNITNILGYLPIIGTIVGIVKLALLSKAEKAASTLELNFKSDFKNESKEPEHKDFLAKLVFPALHDVKSFGIGFKYRAIVETASLGILLLIPDLIASISRSLAKK